MELVVLQSWGLSLPPRRTGHARHWHLVRWSLEQQKGSACRDCVLIPGSFPTPPGDQIPPELRMVTLAVQLPPAFPRELHRVCVSSLLGAQFVSAVFSGLYCSEQSTSLPLCWKNA